MFFLSNHSLQNRIVTFRKTSISKSAETKLPLTSYTKILILFGID